MPDQAKNACLPVENKATTSALYYPNGFFLVGVCKKYNTILTHTKKLYQHIFLLLFVLLI